MKYPIAERTLVSRLAAGSPNMYTSLSHEPAPYSIPDPAASPSSADSSAQAIHSIATLPGCAARVSLDIDEVLKAAAQPALLPSPSMHRTLPPLARNGSSGDGRGGRYPTALLAPATILPTSGGKSLHYQDLQQPHQYPNQGPGLEQCPPARMHVSEQGGQQGASSQDCARRDPGGAQRQLRPSVDAAAGAQVLGTVLAAEAAPQPSHLSDPQPMTTAFAFRGRSLTESPVGLSSPLPSPPLRVAQSVPMVLTDGGSADAQTIQSEWTFGDNLQHARVAARYAAMDAVDDVVYEPPNGSRDSDSDGDSSGRKARSAWKVLASLLGSSKVQKFGKGATSPAGARGPSGGGTVRLEEEGKGRGAARNRGPTISAAGTRADGGADGDEPAAKVVRSRDSTRLLRVHRCRVGIDREGQRPQRPLLPSHSMANARASSLGEDLSDPATAAIIAAAAAFSALTEAEAQRA